MSETPPNAIEMSASRHRFGALVERAHGLLTRLAALESRWYAARLEAIPIVGPIYVTGLARAGSTIVLEVLAAHPEVATHRYRDVPPIQVPLWWNAFLELVPRRAAEPVERAHKDGLLVTPESPEAFEEVLWNQRFADRDAAFDRFYRDHLRKILLVRGGRRYVAKNNYHVARLGYLYELFPDARFVIPVRHPEAHVASLVKQHRLFCREEQRDARILAHMQRLRHFEFGLDRRALELGDRGAADEVRRLWAAGKDAAGYALQWAQVYGFVLDRIGAHPGLAEATMIVRYEDLCDRPETTLRAVYAHCRLEAGAALVEAQARRLHRPDYYRPDFSDHERQAIAAATDAVARRLGYAADAAHAAGDARAV